MPSTPASGDAPPELVFAGILEREPRPSGEVLDGVGREQLGGAGQRADAKGDEHRAIQVPNDGARREVDQPELPLSDQRRKSFRFRDFLNTLGPGLITGASDDDPSGIGTYSQAGAQLGYGIGWTMSIRGGPNSRSAACVAASTTRSDSRMSPSRPSAR